MGYLIWNTLINIKNNQKTKKSYIILKNHKICINILTILWDENFISGYKEINTNFIKVFLKYIGKNPVLINIKFLSKPSKRFYLSVKQCWKIKTDSTILILTTSKGFLTLESCKKYNIGGEPFLFLY